MKKPKLIIFAGANGSGKTTVANHLLEWSSVDEFVNADNIAYGLSPRKPAGQAVAAGRLVIKRIDDLIAKGESFAIETTLSGNLQYRKLLNAIEAGYIIEMYYIFCNDVEINIERVKTRVKQGGHDVPEIDIRRRYWKSLQNFDRYSKKCDIISVVDTHDGRHLIYRNEKGYYNTVFDTELFEIFKNKLVEAKNER